MLVKKDLERNRKTQPWSFRRQTEMYQYEVKATKKKGGDKRARNERLITSVGPARGTKRSWGMKGVVRAIAPLKVSGPKSNGGCKKTNNGESSGLVGKFRDGGQM